MTTLARNPGTSILTHGAAAPAQPFSRELHPLQPVHITAEDVKQDRLPKTLMDLHESIRRSTMSIRQDPGSAPCYVRGLTFANSNANAAPVTVTFRHALGRQHTGLHACRSQGAAWAGYEVPNPPGVDGSQYVTVTTMVPGATSAVFDLKLWGD